MSQEKSAANPFGRSLLRAMAGAAVGFAAIVLLGLVSGLWLLLLSPFGIVLILSAVIATFVTATAARLWRRPLRAWPIMAISALLTIAMFLVPPVALILGNSGHTGPMFG